MTSPTIFAIFMLCSPDLLTCEEQPSQELTDKYTCEEFVKRSEKHHNERHKGQSILLGKCVWRIVKGPDDHE